MSELIDWLRLYLTPGLGIRSWQKLLSAFDGPREILEVSRDELRRLAPGINREVLEAVQGQEQRAAAEVELDKALRAGIRIITIKDSLYPEYLRHIFDPPPVLYLKGNPDLLNSRCIGVVGARSATVYGQRVAADLARRLSLQDFTIVSGMALGVDASAHEGALKGSGKTVAVLGSGLDVVYPRQNQHLYDRIAEQGAVISECPLGSQPEPFRFPARNRLISGISLGVMVVEAARRSGSLITARCAMEQGREVFATPGRIDSRNSEGAHRLVKEGAKLVHTVEDITEEFSPAEGVTAGREPGQEESPPPSLTREEENLLPFLDLYPQSFDEILTRTGLSAAKLNELLCLLELKEIVEILPGKMIQRLSV
ncbi:MAG: DNA-processing protein DprA [Desulfurivibrionaceae bacterium]